MRTALLLAIASISALGVLPAAGLANAPEDICSPAGPPEGPVNSEDYNPGLGGELGLNDDFHDDIEEPFDHPGEVISTFSRSLAQDDEAGGVHVLQDVVGRGSSIEE